MVKKLEAINVEGLLGRSGICPQAVAAVSHGAFEGETVY